MKTRSDLGILMLLVMITTMLVACGSDGEDDSGNTSSLTTANLTEDGYFDGMLYYQITSNSPNEVAISKTAKTAVKIEIPAEVNIEGKSYKCTSIGKKAFDGCRGLLSIKIGRNVEIINVNAFLSCVALEEISVDNGNSKYDSRENCNAIVDSRHNSIIIGCKNTTYPSSVFTIGDYAFHGRKGIIELNLPNSIYYIGKMAFSGCDDLKKISVLADCIDEYAFYGCSQLQTADLGIYMSLVGNCAFMGCDNLCTVSCLRKRHSPSIGCNLSFNEGERPQEQLLTNMIAHSDENFSYYITYEYQNNLEVFDYSTYMNGTLYIASGLSDDYKSDAIWGRFGKIVEGAN